MKLGPAIKAKLPVSFKEALKNSIFNYFRLILIELHTKVIPPQHFGQTAEDVLLNDYLPEKRGTYVDIGAGRPISGSNTYGFYKRGWSGICVDPISFNCKMFGYFRPKDQVLNILIGSKKTLIDFWEFEPYVYSTADSEVAEKVVTVPGVRLLMKSQKQVLPLSEIIPVADPLEPTLLSIDVEGFDLQVLESNDWAKFRPRVICVEEWASSLNEDYTSEINFFLRGVNYQRKAWTGLSSIFVEKTYLAATKHWIDE
jgi:hypothetical protein